MVRPPFSKKSDYTYNKKLPWFWCLWSPSFASEFQVQSQWEITLVLSLWSFLLALEILITITLENHPDCVAVAPRPLPRTFDYNHKGKSLRFCFCGPLSFSPKFWLQPQSKVTQILSLWSLLLFFEILITITLENHPDSVSVVPLPFLRNSEYNQNRKSLRFCLCGPFSKSSKFWPQSH